MSDQEQRQIKAMALLEVEDAKSELTALRAKADTWIASLNMAVSILETAKAEDPTDAILVNRFEARFTSGVREALNFDGLMKLKTDLDTAILRLKRAENRKKDFGFAL